MDKNYITEKIWDCLNSQIVPIYAGAKMLKNIFRKIVLLIFINLNLMMNWQII